MPVVRVVQVAVDEVVDVIAMRDCLVTAVGTVHVRGVVARAGVIRGAVGGAGAADVDRMLVDVVVMRAHGIEEFFNLLATPIIPDQRMNKAVRFERGSRVFVFRPPGPEAPWRSVGPRFTFTWKGNGETPVVREDRRGYGSACLRGLAYVAALPEDAKPDVIVAS